MKKRLIIYLALLTAVAGTFYYVGISKQTPTGYGARAHVRSTSLGSDIRDYSGRFILVSADPAAMDCIIFQMDSGQLGIAQKDSEMAKVAEMAYITNRKCNMSIAPDGYIVSINIPRDTSTEYNIKEKLESMDSYIRNYLYWIWHYVWNISRRLR